MKLKELPMIVLLLPFIAFIAIITFPLYLLDRMIDPEYYKWQKRQMEAINYD